MAKSSLADILKMTGARALGAPDVAVSGIAYRSDAVQPGDVFFCISGFARDGHDFAEDAVSRGAVALVTQRVLGVDCPQFLVPDSRVALALAASEFYGVPSRDVAVIGVTGTNGKTTTTYLIDSILRAHGMTTGIIGTVETRVAGVAQEATRTTPESADLQALFATMRDAGVDACAMEVSSHAIDLKRVDGTRFAVAAFTNLTQDHLDYHHTIEEYFSVKRRLFTEQECARRVIDIDSEYGELIATEFCDALTVGRSADAAVRATEEVGDAAGTTFLLTTPQGSETVRLPLAGAYNVSNALLAAGCALALGVSLDAVVDGLQGAPQVPGRLERVDCGQSFSVVVDYAHTPDSLAKALSAVKAVTTGKVICVFGCGGDRDRDKRPLMGRASAVAADYTIVTSDNPRSEDPVGIILEIEDGIAGLGADYEVIVDRRAAIERAISLAEAGDSVLIAGKGHEDYQIFSDHTEHFDDREVAKEVLSGC